MFVKILKVTTTPQLVPVQSGTLSTGLNMKADDDNKARIFYGTDNTVNGTPGNYTGSPIKPGKEKFVPADHFTSGSIYVVSEGGTQTLVCESD